eukprot:COSAG02_NODE_2507_length_8637_cov_2.877138_5_plen_75_part_00
MAIARSKTVLPWPLGEAALPAARVAAPQFCEMNDRGVERRLDRTYRISFIRSQRLPANLVDDEMCGRDVPSWCT